MGSSEGKAFSTARWELVPGRTAVVLIDLQNDFLHENGWYAKSGIDIAHMRRVIEPTHELLEAARAKNVPVIWTRHGFINEQDAGPYMQFRSFYKDGGLRIGTWGFDVYDDFEVHDEDWVVEKSRLSSFFDTKLDTVLKGVDAETVIFTGVVTNQCVAATSKDAMFRNYKAIVVEECTGATLTHLHEPALEMMRVGWADVQALPDTLEQLRNLG